MCAFVDYILSVFDKIAKSSAIIAAGLVTREYAGEVSNIYDYMPNTSWIIIIGSSVAAIGVFTGFSTIVCSVIRPENKASSKWYFRLIEIIFLLIIIYFLVVVFLSVVEGVKGGV